VSTKIILLFSLALDETYAVFKISFATMLHAIGAHTGSDIFHFVVFFCNAMQIKARFIRCCFKSVFALQNINRSLDMNMTVYTSAEDIISVYPSVYS
jgi:hypothetical protein